MLDVHRMNVVELPKLPSRNKGSSVFKRRWFWPALVSTMDKVICAFVGITMGYVFMTQDLKTSLITLIFGFSIPLTLTLYNITVKPLDLATKTFYTDFPVCDCAFLHDDTVLFSGGGGGMNYGIPDQCAIAQLEDVEPTVSLKCNRLLCSNSGLLDSARAQGIVNNGLYDVAGQHYLANKQFKLLGTITPSPIWGLTQLEDGFCGGIGSTFNVFRVCEQPLGPRHYAIGPNKFITHVNASQPLAPQSKEKVLVQCCKPVGSTVCVLMESGDLYSCAIYPEFNCTQVPLRGGRVLDMAVINERCLALLYANDIEFFESHDDGGDWRPICRIPTNAIKMSPRHLRAAATSDTSRYRLFLVGSSATGATALAYATIALKPEPTLVGVWGQRIYKDLEGCPAVCQSANYLALVGNQKFVVLNITSLSTWRAFHRNDTDSPSAHRNLPVTCAAINAKETHLVVGSADYSVILAPLQLKPRTLLASLLRLQRSWIAISEVMLVTVALIWLL